MAVTEAGLHYNTNNITEVDEMAPMKEIPPWNVICPPRKSTAAEVAWTKEHEKASITERPPHTHIWQRGDQFKRTDELSGKIYTVRSIADKFSKADIGSLMDLDVRWHDPKYCVPFFSVAVTPEQHTIYTAAPVDCTVVPSGVQVRIFETGATRDIDAGKNDYEGFYSPMVMHLFGEYMNKHRLQTDGKLRASDNWQKGMPVVQCLKSTWRHLHDLWSLLRGLKVYKERTPSGEKTIVRVHEPVILPSTWMPVTVPDSACGILFNIQALLLQWAKENL